MIKTFVISLIASVILLTIAELTLGWTFDSLEISLIVLVVLGVTYFATRLFRRPREKDR